MTVRTDRITANLPARDLGETAAFYRRLGFEVAFKDEGWMILERGALELEFFPHPGLNPRDSWFSACVRVANLDALYGDWDLVGLPSQGIPRLQAPERIAPGLRMFALVDLNGSLLRCLQAN